MLQLLEQDWEDIPTDELCYALNRSSKWKSPGLDKVPNFCLNIFESLHQDLADEYNNIGYGKVHTEQRSIMEVPE